MMNNCKVSVIMPIHNAEKHLGDCLESILEQSLREIEIICVNDGSTDGTEEMIRSYMKKDERISIINQKNQYAGVARNTGLQSCKGQYVVFWDADDYFESDALEEMYQKIEEDQADVCVCDAVRFRDGSDILLTDVKYLKPRFLPQEIPFSIESEPQNIFNFTTDVPWNKMFRKTFIKQHQLEFEDRVRANDHYFILQALAYAKVITLVQKPLIRYRISSSTSLTSNLSTSPLCTYEALLHAKEVLEEKGIFQNEKVVQSFANRAVNSMIYGMEKQSYGEAFVTIYDTLKNGGFEKLFIEDKGEEFYYSVTVYGKYKKVLEAGPMEYLLYEYSITSDKNVDVSYKHRELKGRYNQLRVEMKELKKEKKLVERELNYIQQKKWYQAVIFLANIKNRITGKGKK